MIELNCAALPRERKEDPRNLIPLFSDERNAKAGKKVTETLDSVWRLLGANDWPDNVREPHNVIDRCMLHAAGERRSPSSTVAAAAQSAVELVSCGGAAGERRDRSAARQQPITGGGTIVSAHHGEAEKRRREAGTHPVPRPHANASEEAADLITGAGCAQRMNR